MAAPTPLKSLLSACIDVARQAGEVMKKVKESGKLDAKDKYVGPSSDQGTLTDPVTIADVESQRLIEHSLLTAFPGITVIGEEGKLEPGGEIYAPKLDLLGDEKFPSMYASIPASDITVWVDPLDGTKSFIMGNLEVVTCLIGISVRGTATAGVIYYPWRDKLVWGVVGHGIGGDLASLSTLEPRGRRSSVCWFAELEKLKKYAYAALKTPVGSITGTGSAGNMIMKVMEGEYDSYFHCANNKWDTCAGEAILRAVGGTLTDFYGKPYFYDKSMPHRNATGVVASMFDHATYLPCCGDEAFLKAQERKNRLYKVASWGCASVALLASCVVVLRRFNSKRSS